MYKKTFSLAIIIAFAFQLGISQRRSPRSGAPVTAAPVQVDSKAVKQEPAVIDDPLNGYVEKGIPPFSSALAQQPDAAAKEFAAAINNFDDKSWPALIGALRFMGFTIIDSDRRVLVEPDRLPGNGMAIYDWETNGMLKLARRGLGTSLMEWVGKGLAQVSEVDSRQFASAILEDLRLQAENKDEPRKRFWARTIIELGKTRENPNDLMNVTAENTRLDAVQLSIWERRLTGDLLAFRARARTAFNSQVRFLNANYEKGALLGPAPCELSNAQGLVMDASANVIGTAHGKLIELLVNKLGDASKGAAVIEKVAGGLGLVNIALSWGKLVAAHMVLKGELNVEDPLPLVRTVNSEPGQKRLMKAKMRADVGNLQYLNCVRTALNAATGLDFSLPSDGPLAERDVAWELTGDASFSGQRASKTGVFKPFVNLVAPEGAKRNFDEQISDETGESQMFLVGAPKIPAVAYMKSVKVRKKAGVRVSVAMKSSRDFAQNWIDIGGATLGIAVGGPIGVLSALPELGFRNKRPIVWTNVPVEDREPCESNWIGTITFTKKTRKTEKLPKGTRTLTEDETVEYYVKGKPPAERPKADAEDEYSKAAFDEIWTGILETQEIAAADVSVRVRNTDRYEGEIDPDPCCSKEESSPGKGVQLKEVDGDLAKEVLVSFMFDGANLHFNLEQTFSTLLFNGTERFSRQTTGFTCKFERDNDGSTSRPVQLMPLAGQNHLFKPRTTRSNGVENFSGIEKMQIPNGEIEISWDLARCA